MFGYVLANEGQLSEEEHRRLRAYYCGLCRTLKTRFGLTGQITLSFDMAFLAILLSSLYDPETSQSLRRCVVHPKQKHLAFSNEMIEYAADMDIALFHFKCLDSWEDDKSLAALGMDKLLQRKYREIEARWPRQCAAIQAQTEKLSLLERKGCSDLDLLCRCTGEMLAEVFVIREDRWAQTLRQMAQPLGEFIYLMDAREDMDRDRKKGAFNPLLCRQDAPDFEEGCHDMLTMLAAQSAEAFETLPVVEDAGILRNTLYSGIWTKYEGIRRKTAQAGKEKPDGQ